MHSVCARCRRTFAAPPPDGTCPQCGGVLVPESDAGKPERPVDNDTATPAPRRQ